MPRGRWVILAVFFLGTLGIEGQAAEPLKLTQTMVALELKEGDFDHYAVELQSNRLFLTAEEHSAVEAFDLRTNKLVQAMSDLRAPHSLVHRSDLRKLFIVSRDAAEIESI